MIDILSRGKRTLIEIDGTLYGGNIKEITFHANGEEEEGVLEIVTTDGTLMEDTTMTLAEAKHIYEYVAELGLDYPSNVIVKKASEDALVKQMALRE